MPRGRRSVGPEACRRRFLDQFPDGFADETYLAWERDYKWRAHRRWMADIGAKHELRSKLDAGLHAEVARAAVRLESGQPLLFSFEKMALKDAVVRSRRGGEQFAEGLYDWLHGPGGERARFERWLDVVQGLPRRQTRVATWPLITVFGFVARPRVPRVPQADDHATRRDGVRVRLRVLLASGVGDLRQPARALPHGPRRPRRPLAARPDRHPVVPLGAGVGRVLVAVSRSRALLSRAGERTLIDAGVNAYDPWMPSDPPEARTHLDSLQALTDTSLAQLDVHDLLVELLSRVRDILDADTAAVLLLDEGSGMLEARAAQGIEEEVRQGVRVPLGAGFAGRIAATRGPIRLDRVDATTVANPILWEKGIRVMLGLPLLSGDRVLGVIHVGRLEDRPFTDDDVELLQVAAERVASVTQSRLLSIERAAATLLERSLLPPRLPRCEGLEFAARYVPAEARSVGGDWYDLFTLPSGKLWIVAGDVAGHGLQAAVVMGRIRSCAARVHACSTCSRTRSCVGSTRRWTTSRSGRSRRWCARWRSLRTTR